MGILLDIITITKDDLDGVSATLKSTRSVRKSGVTRQIIIDSSSDQKTHQLVEEMARREENVVYTWQEPCGISAAFNLGIDLSGAEWLWFLNGGDIFHPNMDCSTLISILHSSNADTILFQLETKQSHVRRQHPCLWGLWPPIVSWIPHPATILKRQLFLTYGYFDTRYEIAMDYEMWLRLFSRDAIVDMISIPITLYDEEGISSNQIKNTSKEVLKILRLNKFAILKRWFNNVWMVYRSIMIYYRNSKNN